jgi:chromosome segregation ATPase
MMAGQNITVEILKDIRDEIRGMRSEQVETNQRLGATNERLDTVETTLLDLAEQQRFVVRYTKAISERDARLEPRVTSLEARVDKLESK